MLKICIVSSFAIAIIGCTLTRDEIDKISESVSDVAAIKAADIAYKKALQEGLSEEVARELSRKAGESAGEIAERLTREALPESEQGKRDKTSAALASILMAILQLLSGAARKVAA